MKSKLLSLIALLLVALTSTNTLQAQCVAPAACDAACPSVCVTDATLADIAGGLCLGGTTQLLCLDWNGVGDPTTIVLDYSLTPSLGETVALVPNAAGTQVCIEVTTPAATVCTITETQLAINAITPAAGCTLGYDLNITDPLAVAETGCDINTGTIFGIVPLLPTLNGQLPPLTVYPTYDITVVEPDCDAEAGSATLSVNGTQCDQVLGTVGVENDCPDTNDTDGTLTYDFSTFAIGTTAAGVALTLADAELAACVNGASSGTVTTDCLVTCNACPSITAINPAAADACHGTDITVCVDFDLTVDATTTVTINGVTGDGTAGGTQICVDVPATNTTCVAAPMPYDVTASCDGTDIDATGFVIIDAQVYPLLTATDASADAGTCGTLQIDLLAADGATVCESQTQACATDGDTFTFDWAGSAFDDGQGCSVLTATTAACANCTPVDCGITAGEPMMPSANVCVADLAGVDVSTIFADAGPAGTASLVQNYAVTDQATGDLITISNTPMLDLTGQPIGTTACVTAIAYTQETLDQITAAIDNVTQFPLSPIPAFGSLDLSGFLNGLNGAFEVVGVQFTVADIQNWCETQTLTIPFSLIPGGVIPDLVLDLTTLIPPSGFCCDLSTTYCLTVDACTVPCDPNVCNAVTYSIVSFEWSGLDGQFTVGLEGTDASIELAYNINGGTTYTVSGGAAGADGQAGGQTLTGVTSAGGTGFSFDVCFWENDCGNDTDYDSDTDFFGPCIGNADDPFGDSGNEGAGSTCETLTFDIGQTTVSGTNYMISYTVDCTPVAITNVTANPDGMCNGADAEYTVCFDVTGGSGNYDLLDAAGAVLGSVAGADGNLCIGPVTVANSTAATTIDVSVADNADITCIAGPITITIPDCSTPPVMGCTDPCDPNFDPLATVNDPAACAGYDDTCNADCTAGPFGGAWDAATCSCIGEMTPVNGCTDPAADNYDPAANCDDGNCTFSSPSIAISDPCGCGNAGNILVTIDGVEVVSFIETVTIDIPTGAAGVDIIETGNVGILDGSTPGVPTSPAFSNQGDTDGDGFDEWTATFYHAPSTGYSLMVNVEADGVTTPLAISNSCTQCVENLDVPTVGEWGLIILALMMSITAIVGIRQRKEDEAYS